MGINFMYHECKRGRNEMIYVASARSSDNEAGKGTNREMDTQVNANRGKRCEHPTLPDAA